MKTGMKLETFCIPNENPVEHKQSKRIYDQILPVRHQEERFVDKGSAGRQLYHEIQLLLESLAMDARIVDFGVYL